MALSAGITRDEAWELLKKYNSDAFHLERGAGLLGWTLEDLIDRTIKALRTFRP